MHDDDIRERVTDEQELRGGPAARAFPKPARQLKIEALPGDDNLLEQLVESLAVIAGGIEAIHDLALALDAKVERLASTVARDGSPR